MSDRSLLRQRKRTLEERGWTFRWIITVNVLWALLGGVIGVALGSGEWAAGITGAVVLALWACFGWWVGGIDA